MRLRLLAGFSWVAACLLASSCGRGATADPSVAVRQAAPSITQPQSRGVALEEGLIIGEFSLPPHPVIDGDTIRVDGLEDSIRLLGLDTEEKIRGRRDRAAIEADFDGYLVAKRGDRRRPVKAATPIGDEASAFAKAFFEGAETVRLERDDPKALRGRFGRALAYAFVSKDGKWVSYNIECVRAGFSPYFTKYGYSHRFHNQFARAEQEARDAKRGIWNPEARHYDDYEERKAWWDARANFIRAFDHEAASNDDHVLLTRVDAETRLAEMLGREVTVLGTVAQIRYFKGLVRVVLAGADRFDFPIIFRDRLVFDQTEVARASGEPITVRGKVERYAKGNYQTLQIVVEDPAQVTIAATPPPRNPQDGRARETNQVSGR